MAFDRHATTSNAEDGLTLQGIPRRSIGRCLEIFDKYSSIARSSALPPLAHNIPLKIIALQLTPQLGLVPDFRTLDFHVGVHHSGLDFHIKIEPAPPNLSALCFGTPPSFVHHFGLLSPPSVKVSLVDLPLASFFTLLPSMKRVGKLRNTDVRQASTSMLPTNVPTAKVTYHIDATPPKTVRRYVGTVERDTVPALSFDGPPDSTPDNPDESPMHIFGSVSDATGGSVPAYETTSPSCPEEKKKTQNDMGEFAAKTDIFLDCLLSRYHSLLLHTPCACGVKDRLRTVACGDCLQAELLCPQCWLNRHRNMPTHWGFVWNEKDRFFEKTDFSRVMKNAVIHIGHHGRRCTKAGLGRSFTLVDSNGIHATTLSFCQCEDADAKCEDEYQQLLRAGIFPGSVKEPKMGYTVSLLAQFRQDRNQGKSSAYNFVLVLQRLADPHFEDSVPDIYANFLIVTRFHQDLDILMRRGSAHGVDEPLSGESDRPYPHRPVGYMGLQCAACPERGVNMPFEVHVKTYLRHNIVMRITEDGNFKANLFFKRDDGTEVCLTDGRMYFPKQEEFVELAKKIIVTDADKEVPCNAHIGSIRHQGQSKYGNTAVSGVIGSACDHGVVGAFVDMLKGEAFGLVSYALYEHLRRTNSPPHAPESVTGLVLSYDSFCSFVVGMVDRAEKFFPTETWLHDLLRDAEGQIPAAHIPGHGPRCQAIWQAVYFACRAHFHGESAEAIWAFLNGLGSSTRQMTGPARHDTMNFVIDAWNTSKNLRQAKLLADQRLDALQLFELHMAIMEDLSRQHATKVAAWSRKSRLATIAKDGTPESVYQHTTTTVLTIENALGSLISEERNRQASNAEEQPKSPVAQWIKDGIDIEREEGLIIALLKFYREHPLADTWDTITKLRDGLNATLKTFRERQSTIYPRLRLSALDVDEPELTAVQLPSYRMKHGQRVATDAEDSRLREAEITLRCGQANSGILAVRDASLALSAVKKDRDDDYRGQAGVTRTKRSKQKAELMKAHEIDMYNRARTALIQLGHMEKDAVEPFPPMTDKDTWRKDTHLQRARGDSRLFDGMAWYLQSGVKLSSTVPAVRRSIDTDDNADDGGSHEPQLLAGTQTLKRAGFTKEKRAAKRLKDIVPDDVVVQSEAEDSDPEMDSQQGKKKKGKKKGKEKEKENKGSKRDGWIWLESIARGLKADDAKLVAYREESDEVQWFRAEAEMYRRLEEYESTHSEMWRVIQRFRYDRAVWNAWADREEERNGSCNGKATFGRMQAAMYKRLQHNATVMFRSADSGAHQDWVAVETYDKDLQDWVATGTFDEMMTKMDHWRDAVFTWMDDMDIYRAYKDF
ncbi:hypothetical protein DFH06DRAFT_1349486 [Mycena polygramma]|nr:hypothetical protein DFH06DRAFT_1349486 [Mycena polygramma]